MLRYYMDHHVSGPITTGLRRRGIDCLTAAEDGRASAGDEDLLQRATDLGRVLFTQDDDLLAIAHRWLLSERDFAGLAYAEQWGITIGQAVLDLQLMAHALAEEEMRNHVEYLPI